MKQAEIRELRRRFASQHGVVSKAQLRALGIDRREVQRRVVTGEWERLSNRVVRLAGAPITPHQALMAACLDSGIAALASHHSAAWLWGLAALPDRHSVTVPRASRAPSVLAAVHRSRDEPGPRSVRAGIPCTNALRTLVDLAGGSDIGTLEDAVDRAVASGLITVEGLVAEVRRLSRPGRQGVGRMREVLLRRGFVGEPRPSVLESKLHRLLQQHRLRPICVEVHFNAKGQYRIDAAVSDDVLVEVDGYAYHHTPEQKTEDERRRNRIRLTGKFLLVYTWRDVVYDGSRVIAEIRRAVAQTSTPLLTQLTGAPRRPPVL